MRPWLEAPPVSGETGLAAQRLAAALALHPLAAQALAQRGLSDPPAALAFLDPLVYQPCPPEALPDLPLAVERLLRALEAGEAILVWGDFDVDGQTAAALLVGALRALAGPGGERQIHYHIPVRAVESHGVGRAALEARLAAGPRPGLLLTCDTGISDFEALEYARAQGIDVIVTDHHALASEPVSDSRSGEVAPAAYRLPPALAVVTPRRLPDGHPLSGLPGVGVAYKLVEALCARRGRPELAAAQQDLAALGIVADVATLRGDTRYLLQMGLRCLRQTPRPGLQAMFRLAGLDPASLGEEQIGFSLAPRLNALGRLSDANPAVELLTTADPSQARFLAQQLEGFNAHRQMLTAQTLQSAQARLEREPGLLRQPILALAQPGWEAGVIGIVASRLVELYARPVVLIAVPPTGPGRGSARSTAGVDITAVIARAGGVGEAGGQGLLLGYGGHPMAAGFSILPENIPAFIRRLGQAAPPPAPASWDEDGPAEGWAAPAAPSQAALQIDAELAWEEANLALAQSLARLAPYGPGNPPLVFASRGLLLRGQSVVGRNQQHLALSLEDAQGRSRRVMWWQAADRQADLAPQEAPERRYDAAYTLRLGQERGQPAAVIELVDLRPSREPAPPAAPALRVIDLRGAARPLEALRAWLRANPPASFQVWAEGEAPERLAQALEAAPRSRFDLAPCEVLVVWTAPPGPGELQAALARAWPQAAVLVGLAPPYDSPQPFLQRLAGLVKHALAAHQGRINLERLAAALAQRAPAAQLGLEWLAAQGHIRLERVETGEQYAARPGALAPADPALAAERLAQIGQLLDESRAYRAYFGRAADPGLQPSALLGGQE